MADVTVDSIQRPHCDVVSIVRPGSTGVKHDSPPLPVLIRQLISIPNWHVSLLYVNGLIPDNDRPPFFRGLLSYNYLSLANFDLIW